MTEVCHNVAIEPHLQPLTGRSLHGASSISQDGARLDVAADGFWGSRFERAFFDIRVFNPFAPSNQRSSLQACYRNHENVKKRAYHQRVREVEHGTFSPLVFSCTGGMGRVDKRLAALVAAKRDEPYSTTMGWIRCRLSYSLLRAAIMCVRGARSTIGHASREHETPIGLVSSEGHERLACCSCVRVCACYICTRYPVYMCTAVLCMYTVYVYHVHVHMQIELLGHSQWV